MTVGFGGQSQQRWGADTLNAQETMRDLLLTDAKGEPCSTAQARKSGLLLLAFFKADNSACPPAFGCLRKLADAYSDSGKVTVWGVSQSDREATEGFAQRYGITFPLLVDHELWHSMIFGITNVPTIYLTDSKGIVQQKTVGWDGKAMNEISERIAGFLGRDPVPVVDVGEPAPD